MSKVERLKVSEYAAVLPGGATTVFRVEYGGAGTNGGFVELLKTPPAAPASPAAPNQTPKADFWVKTEHLHLPAKVTQSLGEQLEQDLGSVAR